MRLSQRQKGGPFYRTVWLSGRGKSVASLGTRNRDEAERLGHALLKELQRGDGAPPPARLTLGELWHRYSHECDAFLDNKPLTRRGDTGRAKILLAVLGEKCEVSKLSARDHAMYSARRKAGGIRISSSEFTRPVRTASVWGDLVLLHAMLHWATTVRYANGARLLNENPLAGVRLEKEQNPVRPVASWERFRRTRAALRDFQQEAARATGSDVASITARLAAQRWIKIELALVLAEATGRRLGALRQLHWEDVDFRRRTIRWRAAYDKKGKETVVPIPVRLAVDLRRLRTKLGTPAGWVFAGERRPAQPMDRHLFDKWLRVAEARAGLEKLVGGLWHPYRRKWATERKHHSVVDVAAAGGWRDTQTLLTCYQQPDAESMLAVMSEPRKIRERSL
ncbi:MAG: tyrosine-type recombinase/integrase, partial [Gemmatimonadales bacterium]